MTNQHFEVMAQIVKAAFGSGSNSGNEVVSAPQTQAEAIAAFKAMGMGGIG